MSVFIGFTNKLALIPALSLIVLLAACGGGGPAPQPTGNFSNASLNGQYNYRLIGLYYSSTGSIVPYTEAGVFAANGSGGISSGTDDFEQSGSALSTTSTTGTYSINNDGTGTVVLNNTTLGTVTLDVTLVSSSKLYIIENDPANTYGEAELQSSSTLATTPSGTFTFRFHDQGVSVRAGAMTISSGSVTGSEDLLSGGVLDNNTGSALTISSGTFATPTSGRGTGTFSDGLTTVSFVYYVVDANNIRFLRTDSGLTSLGRAELQSGSFTNGSLKGGFAFGSVGDDTYAVGGVNIVGALTADGNGNVTGGEFDGVRDGISIGAAVAINNGGTYSVSSNGRAVVNYTTNLGTSVQEIYWLVSSSRAFFLTNDSTKIEDGIADLQQTTTFSNATLTGQYAFVMGSLNANNTSSIGVPYLDRVGWINTNGSGTVSLYEIVNAGGTAQPSGTLTGTYGFASGNDTTLGRATATISNFSAANNDLVFYVVSNTQAYILQNATGYNISGVMELQ